PGGARHCPTQGRRLGGDHPEAGGDQSQRRTDSDLRPQYGRTREAVYGCGGESRRRSVCSPAPMRGTVGSVSEGLFVCLLPLTVGARQQGAHPCLAFQHRTISAVVLSSRLVIWGTSGQVIRGIQAALPEAWLSR